MGMRIEALEGLMDICYRFSIERLGVGSALKTGFHLKKCPFDAFNVTQTRPKKN